MTAAEQAFDQGMRHLSAGERRAAADAFRRALRLEPGLARARYQLGNVLQEEGRWAEAEEQFRSALALEPAQAEAHNNLGVVLQMMGRIAEAQASYMRAADLRPVLDQPYLNLGRMFEQTGRRAEANDWYRKGLERSTHPEVFRHLLAATEGAATSGRAPASYVRETFDGFAAQFDQHLVGTLDYRVPSAIAAAIADVRAFPPAAADVLDLGCGTGLSGIALRAIARRLIGVDIAPRMLDQARASGCYDLLVESEVLVWMRSSAATQFDVIVAADVFIYIGELEAVFAETARLARPGALFAFSIEVCDGKDWQLNQSGRYAQSAAYIHSLAATHSFTLMLERKQPIRKPIVGLLYVLARK